MSLALVRVDDRLIHGQVVAVWMRAVRADRIVIVDDATAADEFLATVLTLAAPPGVPVEVLSTAPGGARLGELAHGSERALVLLRSPATALSLREAGVPISILNVGGIGAGPGRRLLHRSISASDAELDTMRRLEGLGTRVELRVLPDDRPIAFASLEPSSGAGDHGVRPESAGRVRR